MSSVVSGGDMSHNYLNDLGSDDEENIPSPLSTADFLWSTSDTPYTPPPLALDSTPDCFLTPPHKVLEALAAADPGSGPLNPAGWAMTPRRAARLLRILQAGGGAANLDPTAAAEWLQPPAAPPPVVAASGWWAGAGASAAVAGADLSSSGDSGVDGDVSCGPSPAVAAEQPAAATGAGGRLRPIQIAPTRLLLDEAGQGGGSPAAASSAASQRSSTKPAASAHSAGLAASGRAGSAADADQDQAVIESPCAVSSALRPRTLADLDISGWEHKLRSAIDDLDTKLRSLPVRQPGAATPRGAAPAAQPPPDKAQGANPSLHSAAAPPQAAAGLGLQTDASSVASNGPSRSGSGSGSSQGSEAGSDAPPEPLLSSGEGDGSVRAGALALRQQGSLSGGGGTPSSSRAAGYAAGRVTAGMGPNSEDVDGPLQAGLDGPLPLVAAQLAESHSMHSSKSGSLDAALSCVAQVGGPAAAAPSFTQAATDPLQSSCLGGVRLSPPGSPRSDSVQAGYPLSYNSILVGFALSTSLTQGGLSATSGPLDTAGRSDILASLSMASPPRLHSAGPTPAPAACAGSPARPLLGTPGSKPSDAAMSAVRRRLGDRAGSAQAAAAMGPQATAVSGRGADPGLAAPTAPGAAAGGAAAAGVSGGMQLAFAAPGGSPPAAPGGAPAGRAQSQGPTPAPHPALPPSAILSPRALVQSEVGGSTAERQPEWGRPGPERPRAEGPASGPPAAAGAAIDAPIATGLIVAERLERARLGGAQGPAGRTEPPAAAGGQGDSVSHLPQLRPMFNVMSALSQYRGELQGASPVQTVTGPTPSRQSSGALATPRSTATPRSRRHSAGSTLLDSTAGSTQAAQEAAVDVMTWTGSHAVGTTTMHLVSNSHNSDSASPRHSSRRNNTTSARSNKSSSRSRLRHGSGSHSDITSTLTSTASGSPDLLSQQGPAAAAAAAGLDSALSATVPPTPTAAAAATAATTVGAGSGHTSHSSSLHQTGTSSSSSSGMMMLDTHLAMMARTHSSLASHRSLMGSLPAAAAMASGGSSQQHLHTTTHLNSSLSDSALRSATVLERLATAASNSMLLGGGSAAAIAAGRVAAAKEPPPAATSAGLDPAHAPAAAGWAAAAPNGHALSHTPTAPSPSSDKPGSGATLQEHPPSRQPPANAQQHPMTKAQSRQPQHESRPAGATAATAAGALGALSPDAAALAPRGPLSSPSLLLLHRMAADSTAGGSSTAALSDRSTARRSRSRHASTLSTASGRSAVLGDSGQLAADPALSAALSWGCTGGLGRPGVSGASATAAAAATPASSPSAAARSRRAALHTLRASLQLGGSDPPPQLQGAFIESAEAEPLLPETGSPLPVQETEQTPGPGAPEPPPSQGGADPAAAATTPEAPAPPPPPPPPPPAAEGAAHTSSAAEAAAAKLFTLTELAQAAEHAVVGTPPQAAARPDEAAGPPPPTTLELYLVQLVQGLLQGRPCVSRLLLLGLACLLLLHATVTMALLMLLLQAF